VNVSYPTGVDYYEMYPMYPDEQNVEPRGQTDTIPIFTVVNNHPSEEVDVYIDMTESWVEQQIDCTEIEFNNPNESVSFNVNTTMQRIINAMDSGDTLGVWSYEDFTCSSWSDLQYSLYNPVFTFKPICSDCVITTDFEED